MFNHKKTPIVLLLSAFFFLSVSYSQAVAVTDHMNVTMYYRELAPSNNASGVFIKILSQNVTFLNATVNASVSATRLFVYNTNNLSKILFNTTNKSSNAFYGYYNFSAGETYLILVDKEGSPFNRTYAQTSQTVPINRTNINYIGSRDLSNTYNDTYMYDFLSITTQNTSELYNYTAPIIYKSYTLTLSQNPSDINSSYAGLVNVSLTVSGDTPPSTSSATLNFKIVTTLSSCAQYYQSTCNLLNNTLVTEQMSKVNNTYFYDVLDDTDYYPAYYGGNYSKIQNTVHQNFSLYNNNYLRFNVFNMSIATDRYFMDVEIHAYNLSNQPLDVWYCNSSYSTGNPVSSANCELIDAFTPIGQPHTHNQSRHYAIPISITITKTQNSSFLFVAQVPIANGWKIGYINDTAYNNLSFMTGNYNTWAYTSQLFDVHLHEFRNNDYIQYYAVFSDNNVTVNTTNTSISYYDFYNISNFPPSAPLFISTCNTTITLNSSGVPVTFSWTNSSDLNNDSFTYNLSIINLLGYYLINDSIPQTQNSYTATLSSLDYPMTTYNNFMKVCDAFGCDTVTSICTFNVCVSDWEYTLTPCVSGVRQINYVDTNNCPIAYEFPSDNATYTSCTYTQNIKYDFDDEQLIIFILIFFIIISIWIGLAIFPYAFLMTALFFILLMLLFLLYNYPSYLIIASVVMSIFFVIIAFFSARNR